MNSSLYHGTTTLVFNKEPWQRFLTSWGISHRDCKRFKYSNRSKSEHFKWLRLWFYLHIILLLSLSNTIPVTGSRHLASVWTLPSARVQSVRKCRACGLFQQVRCLCILGFWLRQSRKTFTHRCYSNTCISRIFSRYPGIGLINIKTFFLKLETLFGHGIDTEFIT